MTRSFDSSINRTIETLETDREQTVRVDPDTLAFVSTVTIDFQLDESEQSVEAVSLRLTMLRSQLLKLVQAGYETGLTIMDLTKFDPIKPVTLALRAKSDMLEPLAAARSANMSFENIATSVDPSGFPALLNLENYELTDLRQ